MALTNISLKKRLVSLRAQPYYYRFILTLLALFAGYCIFAQKIDSLNQSQIPDSGRSDFVSRMKKLGKIDSAKNNSAFKADKIEFRQDQLIEDLRRITEEAKTYLKRGIDTHAIKTDLNRLEHWSAIAADGIFINTGTVQTHRNLATSSKVVEVIKNIAIDRQNQLDKYQETLVNFRYRMDSLSSDPAIYELPSDSTALTEYLLRVLSAARSVRPIDSTIKQAIRNVQALQTEAHVIADKLTRQLEDIERYQKELANKRFNHEVANFWSPIGFARPLSEIIDFSTEKASLMMTFYSRQNAGKIGLVLLLIIAATIYLRSLKKIYTQNKLLNSDHQGQLVLRYPFLSATMIVLNLFQFIFSDPPFLFSAIFWIISAACLTIIFRNFISRTWMRLWLSMLILFLFACLDNLMLQASRTERWCMLILAIAGIATALFFLLKGRRDELKEKWIIYFLGLVVVFGAGSIIGNLYGRYNASKILLTSGYFSFILGISFLWTARLINEALSLASSVYKEPDRKLFYINHEKLGRKAPSLFHFFLFLGWLILVGRNFYAFHLISDPLIDFLTNERTIGNYSYTISSIFIFIGIIALSAVISRIISFFASDKDSGTVRSGQRGKKAGAGSWILLVRIAIFSLGLFVAFAAAGVPMDKVTIILGALGVGIGFGLQTLVNNLVSGLIIAFEKPVNVGDIIEVSGHSGTMKSIGFRSSILSTFDGADIVVPNGDLLNAHLVNWTLSGSRRRVEIIIGIAYGTDLEKARNVLNHILHADERVLKYPDPAVVFQQFANSSIEVRLLFWVQHYLDWLVARSDIILAIDNALKQHGIEIPFPQQDLHIRSVSDEAKQALKGESESSFE
jgi:potassium efflux system protein